MGKIYIPPHMIPTKDKRQDSGWQPEPLYDRVPPPNWNPRTGHAEGESVPHNRDRPAYNPDVPRWDF